MICDDAARWFLDRRGITRETLEAFGVHHDPDQAALVIFPYGTARKYRHGLEKDGRRFWWDPPAASGSLPFLPPDFQPRDWVLLVEGETDTMATWQALPDDLREKVTVVGLSGVGAWEKTFRDKPEQLERVFGAAKKVFVVFDREDPYENPNGSAAVEAAWGKIRADLGRKARRVILPQGINDLAEFFQRYDWAALAVLLRKANEPIRHYKRLDLSQEVPPVKWLIEDLLVSYEAHVLAADGGTYKTWLCQALALAIAGDDTHFLGLPIKKHGRVIYVDEEGSADLVIQRLNALGLTDEHRKNIDYLWYAGVDLLNEPEKLLEEALDLEPELIVIESLSRVAIGAEENDNTAMTQLMRRGVIPLARDTGAAVLVTHHTGKDGSKIRGAGAIRNAADQTIGMRLAETELGETGAVNIFPDKPRRELTYLTARLNGSMKNGEDVRWALAGEELPF